MLHVCSFFSFLFDMTEVHHSEHFTEAVTTLPQTCQNKTSVKTEFNSQRHISEQKKHSCGKLLRTARESDGQSPRLCATDLIPAPLIK